MVGAKPFEVKDVSLHDLLNLQFYKLEIPAYQRPYEWKEKDVTLLLQDVKSTFEAVAPEDYLLLGSVLLRGQPAERSSDLKSCEVVDGQQRLSTIMLLYSVLYQRGHELGMDVDSESERFLRENKRSLELHHALGGAAGEDLSKVEQSWKELTNFGSTVSESVLQRKDRYCMRWNNIYNWPWLKKQCKTEKRVRDLLCHLDERVYFSVTIIYDLRLALKCFVNCNTTGIWQMYTPAA